jgi:hypothetical protein
LIRVLDGFAITANGKMIYQLWLRLWSQATNRHN